MLTLDPPPETYRWHFAPALSLHLATKFGDDFLLWVFSGVTNWPRMSGHVKVCGCRPMKVERRAQGRRTQTSNGGNRGRCGEVARQTLWGFGGCECEYNFCDMARILRTGENAFRRPCNFKELCVVKRAHITTFALCA